jgi:hypothetical protein
MSYGFGPANAQAAFLPQEFNLPLDDKLAKEAIDSREQRTALALNVREIGQYETVELITGQTWFSNRPRLTGESQLPRYSYRLTMDLVALNQGPIGAGATTLRVSPVISSIVVPTRCFGAGTIAGPIYVFFPSMFVDFTFNNSNPNVQTVTITNNIGSNMTQCYVTIEYLKQP